MIVPSAAPVFVHAMVAVVPLAGRKLTTDELVPGSDLPVAALALPGVPPV